MHGFCPSQPDSIKCCKSEEETTSEPLSCETESTTIAATTPLYCPGGYNTNCNNGNCVVTCSDGGGGGGNNNNNNFNGRSGLEPPACTSGYNTICTNGICDVTCYIVSVRKKGNRRRRKRSTGEPCEGGGEGGGQPEAPQSCDRQDGSCSSGSTDEKLHLQFSCFIPLSKGKPEPFASK